MSRWKLGFRNLILSTILCFLGACASNHGGDLGAGKQDFLVGDYHRAFYKLQPLAKKGYPDAQYAVGYMYFYGLGTVQNDEAAMKWMSAAASKGQPEAVAALEKLDKQKKNRSTDTLPAEGSGLFLGDSQSLPPEQPSPPPSLPMPTTATVNMIVEKSQEVPPPGSEEKSQEIPLPKSEEKPVKSTSTGYALQLMASSNVAALKAIVAKNQLSATIKPLLAQPSGRDVYVLLYGHYPTAKAARAAIDKLPENLQQLHPWVRDLSTL